MMISFCTNILLSSWKPRNLLVLVVLLLVACNQISESQSQPNATVTSTIPVLEDDALPNPVVITEIPSSIESEEISTPEEETQVSKTPTPNPFEAIPGALVQVSIQSQVGILLDEFPENIREEIVAELMTQSEEMWLARATRQVRLTRLLLNFHNFGIENKGQLPLPPQQLWDIRLDDTGPTRQTIQGHDLLILGYYFQSTLLTSVDSPARAEPSLANIGGTWEEAFVFPIDPDFLLQRTGNACVNEGGFPANSFDSENIWRLFDFNCQANSGGAAGCHRTTLPDFSCREALVARVGEVETVIRFERLPWSIELADQVRLGELTSPNAPDLKVVADDLTTNRIVYRYFEPDDCAVEEGAVGGTGWRRLLQFDATVHNVGGQPLEVGEATAEDLENHIFIYNPCHAHFHYSNYGSFFIQEQLDLLGSKQAFCVQSTSRLSNNEITPLTHNYSCGYQGIQVGWVDEYIAGLDSQWVDITELDIPLGGVTIQLGFRSNGDQMLCEGSLIRDQNGSQLWEPSGLFDTDGHAVNRPQCEFILDWNLNNEGVQDVFVPAKGSFISSPCINGEIGPLRNCGFTEMELDETDWICTPGEIVFLSIDELEEPLIVRSCERSALLQTGVACSYTNSLVNVIIDGTSDQPSFTCPMLRDSDAVTGGYAIYISPLYEA